MEPQPIHNGCLLSETEVAKCDVSKQPPKKKDSRRAHKPAGAAITHYLDERRLFNVPESFLATQPLTTDLSLYEEAAQDRLAFWAKQSREMLFWHKDFHTVLEWNPPYAKWFLGGQLNASYICVDRHVERGLGGRVAFHWEGEPGDCRTFTYSDLLQEVSKFGNVLKTLGVKKGDRVCIYMPMIPESVIAMLACARIGAAHSVVFGGFSADALADRIVDAGARVLITADGGFRRGEAFALKPTADAAVTASNIIEHVVVVRRTAQEVQWSLKDKWYHDLMTTANSVCEAEALDSEHLLYILYTSGTTAKPKGIMHTTGGYLTQVAFTQKYFFDLKPESDVFWCTADIGWVTGHSYVVYGPLANGATSVMYEGTADTPNIEGRIGKREQWPKDRFWGICEKYGVTQFYTAPTAIRTFMRWGTQEVKRHDLSKLKLLASVGEIINPEAWIWYYTEVGGCRCPVVDTWWQTETGAHMIAPLPGVLTTKPGSAVRGIPGVQVEAVDDYGNNVVQGGGYLTVSEPWPSMLRGIWRNPERYVNTYWTEFPGRYFSGDGVKIDNDSYFWLLGRVDDVMNVSGHRLSTAEVESALVGHPAVVEAAVVGASNSITGEAIVAFCIVRSDIESMHTEDSKKAGELREEIRHHVDTKLGAIARPKVVVIVEELPKTRSGKIMRRLLRDVAEGRHLGDTTTLSDFNVMDEIRERSKQPQSSDEEE